MTNQHPITPPLELVEQRWNNSQSGGDFVQEFATFFARWGSDQELDACCEWLDRNNQWAKVDIDELRDARRPKPPSLKEQALEALAESALDTQDNSLYRIIHKALEQLPND